MGKQNGKKTELIKLLRKLLADLERLKHEMERVVNALEDSK